MRRLLLLLAIAAILAGCTAVQHGEAGHPGGKRAAVKPEADFS